MTEISDRPWSGTKSSYGNAAEYCAACVIDENAPGDAKHKDRCKLPVYEPQAMGGLLNRHAVRAAVGRLVRASGGVEATMNVRRSAALRLLDFYRELGESPPASLRSPAGVGIGGPPQPTL